MLVNYGKAVNNELVRAKAYVIIGGVRWFNPNAEKYAQADDGPWLPIEDKPPVTDEKHYAVAVGWKNVGGKCVRQYEIREVVQPPRRWSRLSIKTALAQAEMLAAARQFLASVEIATGYTAWEALTDCDYIEEGYPDAEKWDAILDGAAATLGKSREEIDAFLAQIPTEQ